MPEIDAIHFEGVKISMSQSKEGVVLRLGVHPDDCPSQLLSDWVGSRYMVAMVKLSDDDTPEVNVEKEDIRRIKASAGALCRNEKFQRWILSGTGQEINEKNAIALLRDTIGISSRSEFETNAHARAAFTDMREEFNEWLKSTSQR